MPRSAWRRSRARPEATAPCLWLQAQAISARRQAEAGLHHLAFQDSLTGLPNRRRFRELLVQAVNRAQGAPTHHFAVMFLYFDRFKLINLSRQSRNQTSNTMASPPPVR